MICYICDWSIEDDQPVIGIIVDDDERDSRNREIQLAHTKCASPGSWLVVSPDHHPDYVKWMEKKGMLSKEDERRDISEVALWKAELNKLLPETYIATIDEREGVGRFVKIGIVNVWFLEAWPNRNEHSVPLNVWGAISKIIVNNDIKVLFKTVQEVEQLRIYRDIG